MTFNCHKLHHKCKAECCSICPIPGDVWVRNVSKINRHPERIIDLGTLSDPHDKIEKHFIQPITKDGMCPFLNDDYTCNIYDDRPGVCRDFGNETDPDLICAYQDKDGNVRSRQETRNLQRQCQNRMEKLINFERTLK